MFRQEHNIGAGWVAMISAPSLDRIIVRYEHPQKGGPHRLREAIRRGNILEDVRQARGRTKQDLARKLGVSRWTIYRWTLPADDDRATLPDSESHRSKIRDWLLAD
jgi:hypothetical protein